MAPEFHDLPIASGRIPVPVSRSPAPSAPRNSRRSSAGTSLPARGNRSAEMWRTRHVPYRSRLQRNGQAPRGGIRLESKWKDLPRAALESLALEAYRSRALTAAQVRRLLGFQTRMEGDAFLKKQEIFDYLAAEFDQERENLP